MSDDTFMRISKIKGGSTDHEHKDWINAWDLRMGFSQPRSPVASTAGGMTTSKTVHRPLIISKGLDLASAQLMQNCCSGETMEEIIIERFRANGEKRVKYMEVRIYNAIVNNIDPYSIDNYMAEQIAFVYSKIGWRQTIMSDEGRELGNTSGGWDLGTNRPFTFAR
jgi:type VI secretion system secreted protein Hcp